MAGSNPNPPYYTPTSKPNSQNTNFSSLKRTKLSYLALVAILCGLSYLIGSWNSGGGGGSGGGGTVTSSTSSVLATATVPCIFQKNTSTLSTTTRSSSAESRQLDFSTHHAADVDGGDIAQDVKVYPPCDVKYSEYTPCEDPTRSLKFSRDRLIYRERHCPEKNELLKCRIPAPFGYKNPFKWPVSRDLAWYANVPHKELTVEKAVQNWIRFEGDRFKFPGGGTMFPNGADAYIDDIGKLINLNDGSIRTAIDTGCGVIIHFSIFSSSVINF